MDVGQMREKLGVFDEKTREIIGKDIAKMAAKETFYRNGSDALQMGISMDARRQQEEIDTYSLLQDALIANGSIDEDIEISELAEQAALKMFSELTRERLKNDVDFARAGPKLDELKEWAKKNEIKCTAKHPEIVAYEPVIRKRLRNEVSEPPVAETAKSDEAKREINYLMIIRALLTVAFVIVVPYLRRKFDEYYYEP